jgi:hypothetical protein
MLDISGRNAKVENEQMEAVPQHVLHLGLGEVRESMLHQGVEPNGHR